MQVEIDNLRALCGCTTEFSAYGRLPTTRR